MSASPQTNPGLLLAEFDSPEALERAIVALRALGLVELDAFTPFPVPSLEAALTLPPSRLPYAVLAAGLLGAGGAFALQRWLSVTLYPLNVGGTPYDAWPAFIPITFETMVLAASLTGVIGLLARTQLPRLWHPLFDVAATTSASVDRFWVGVSEVDPKYDERVIVQALERVGALRVVAPSASLGSGSAPEEES